MDCGRESLDGPSHNFLARGLLRESQATRAAESSPLIFLPFQPLFQRSGYCLSTLEPFAAQTSAPRYRRSPSSLLFRHHTSIFRRSPPESREGHLQEAARTGSQSPKSLLSSLPFIDGSSSLSLRLNYGALPWRRREQKQLAGIGDLGSGILDPGSGIRNPAYPLSGRRAEAAPAGASGGWPQGAVRAGQGGGACAAAGGAWVGLQFWSRPIPRLVRSPAPTPPSVLCGGVRRRRRREDRRRRGTWGGAAGRAGQTGAGSGVSAAGPSEWPQSGSWPPILLRRGECDRRPPGVRLYSCLPWSGAGSQWSGFCPSVCGWGHRCISKAVVVSVHVRRVHVRESSEGILRAVAAHVRSMFEGGRRGWMGDGSLEERGVWELVYVGVGCRTLQPRVTVCVCGGAGVLLSGTLESCGPACLKGSILPGADTSTPCSPVHPLQAPRGPPARIEDTLSSSHTAPWTGSLIRRLFHVGKDPPGFPAAWALPGGPQAPPWSGLLPSGLGYRSWAANLQGQMVAGWRDRLHLGRSF